MEVHTAIRQFFGNLEQKRGQNCVALLGGKPAEVAHAVAGAPRRQLAEAQRWNLFAQLVGHSGALHPK